MSMLAAVHCGANFILHSAGWLEGGLVDGLREVHASTPISAARRTPISTASRSTTTSLRSTPFARSARASTSSAARTPCATTRPRSTIPRSPTTTPSSSGATPARRTRPCGAPTRNGSACCAEYRGAADRRRDRRGVARRSWRRPKQSRPRHVALRREATRLGRGPLREGRVRRLSNIAPRFEERYVKITDVKCAIIANSPVIRITTDEGITGWSQIETPKPYLQPIVLQLKSWLVGQDPRERRAGHEAHPRARRLQAVGRGGERHRDRAVGHRRQGRQPPDLSPAGRQGARPGAHLSHALPPRGRASAHTPDDYRKWAEYGMALDGRLQHVQAADLVPLLDGAGLPGLPLRRRAARRAVPLSAQGPDQRGRLQPPRRLRPRGQGDAGLEATASPWMPAPASCRTTRCASPRRWRICTCCGSRT